jgi:replicative DNA helicase
LPSFFDEYAPDRFAFIEEFQARVLAALVRLPDWLATYREAMDWRFFESLVHRDLAEMVLDHFDHYRRPPDLVEMAERLSALLDAKKDRAANADAYMVCLAGLYEEDIGSPEYLTDKVMLFARHQAVKCATIKQIELLPKAQEGDEVYDEIEGLMRAALAVGSRGKQTTDDYEETFTQAIYQSFEEMRRPVPTGLEQHDKRLGGGLGYGELGTLIADTGMGKTLALVEFAAGAACAGRHAYYASLEEPSYKLLDRLNRRLSGLTRQEIQEQGPAVEQRIRQLFGLTRGKISYGYFEPGTPLRAIDDAVRRCEDSTGRRVDVVLLDYLDRVAPPRARDNSAKELLELSDQVLGWICRKGEERALWTGSQVTSDGIEAAVVTHKHEAGARAKAHPAAVIIGMSQTAKESQMKPFPTVRLYYDKNRDHASKFADRYSIDYSRSKLIYAGVVAPEEMPGKKEKEGKP